MKEIPRAGDGIRTHDNNVGNVVLCQLSYTRGNHDLRKPTPNETVRQPESRIIWPLVSFARANSPPEPVKLVIGRSSTTTSWGVAAVVSKGNRPAVGCVGWAALALRFSAYPLFILLASDARSIRDGFMESNGFAGIESDRCDRHPDRLSWEVVGNVYAIVCTSLPPVHKPAADQVGMSQWKRN